LAAVPDPPASLDLEVECWAAGRTLVRVFQVVYRPSSFNPSLSPARFRPVYFPDGSVIPTLYGAEAFDAALAETLLHDLDSGKRRSIPYRRVEQAALVRLLPQRELRLAALHGYGLKKAHLHRDQVIDTPPRSYPQTAKWGQALHDHPEQVDGLVWMSRQFDSQRALMLFGDRVAEKELQVEPDSLLPLDAGAGFELASQVALRAGFARITRA
jgi:hypothetical protein